MLKQSFFFKLLGKINKKGVIARWCIFTDKFADIRLAFNFPKDEKGENDTRAKDVIENDNDLIELDIPCLFHLFFQSHRIQCQIKRLLVG